jgi:DNA ligase-1
MNKTFDTLYSRDTLGNIRIWFMEQNGDKYRTVSGLIDGEKVVSEWSHAESKNIGRANQTTSVEQATAEIVAKYKKQLKTGYHTDINNVDVINFVEPMLAQPLHKLSKQPNFIKEKWGIQCKLNGNRCIGKIEGLFTRKGEKYNSVPHIENSLKPFFDKHPNAVLDGELFNYDLRQQLNEISKLIRKTVHISEEDLRRSQELVKFYIYDGYGFDSLDKDTPYETRKKYIDTHIVGSYDYLMKVDTVIIKDENHMHQEFQNLINDQQEGGILRRMDSIYEHKRSKNLVKVKVDEDDEGVILDIKDGDGNWKNAATNVTLKWKDKTFDAVFKGSFERRSDILKEKENWIGKEVKFLYMGLTGKGTPNYGRIDPDNCFSVDK